MDTMRKKSSNCPHLLLPSVYPCCVNMKPSIILFVTAHPESSPTHHSTLSPRARPTVIRFIALRPSFRIRLVGPRTCGFCWYSSPWRGTWPTKPRRATSRLLLFQPTSCRPPSVKPHSTAWRTRSVSRGREIRPAFGVYNALFHKNSYVIFT